MKKRNYLLLSLFLVGTMGLVGCGKNQDLSKEKDNKIQLTDKSNEMSISTSDILEDSNDSKEETKKNTKEKSIVAGTIAVAEILDGLGVENVVGVPESHYGLPEKYKDAEKIGKPMEPDMEIVKFINPDLFVSTSSLEEVNKPKLEQNNINYKFLNLDSVDAIKTSIEDLSKEIGKEENAKKIIDDMNKKLEELSKKTSKKESPKVLFLFGTPKNIMLGTEKSYVGDLLKTLNIHNVANDIIKDSHKPYVPVNMENIVGKDIDIIIRMTHASPKEAKAMLDKEFKNEVWQSMKAVKEGRVIDLDNNLFSVSGGIKFPQALEDLYKNVYESK